MSKQLRLTIYKDIRSIIAISFTGRIHRSAGAFVPQPL